MLVHASGRPSLCGRHRGIAKAWNFARKQESVHDNIEDFIMTDAFKVGDKVQWHSPQGTVHGTIRKKLTSPTTIKGHEVAASPDNPEYLVVSDKTGAEAAHKAGALKKT